jgi:predicted aldo/keto reductase-like oxidoreductase
VKKRSASRRNFLKAVAYSGAGLSVAGTMGGVADRATASEKSEVQPSAKVPRKLLGTTGEKVPILVLGCSQRFKEKYDKILHRAFKEGVDYLDTARVYAEGWSHKTIAPFIKQIGDRKKLWITSKEWLKDGTVEQYTEGLDQCLSELETDYLDLFFMHALDDPRFLDPEYIQMGDALRKSKKTRFFGFSCHGDRMVELLEKAAKVGGIDAIMFRYSFSKYGDLKLNQAIDNCKKAGIGLIAMKTQDSVPKDQEEVVQFRSKDFKLAQAKLKAVWADERIDSAVSHMDNTRKLKQNIAAAKSPVQLSMSDFQQLQRLATATAAYACQGCSEICESHVDGDVKIAKSLRYLMYHESYGDTDRARRLYGRLGPAARAVDGVSFARAEAACPKGIRITERLAKAKHQLGGLA